MSEGDNLNNVFYFDKDEHYINWGKCKSIEKQYWTAVLKNIDPSFEVIVTENTKKLPKYSDNIVVVLKSDEFISRIEYITKVKAVFRNYFDGRYSGDHNVFFLPLPYLGDLGEVSIKPISKRSIDIFFAGQVDYPEREELSKIVEKIKNINGTLEVKFQKNQGFFSGLSINEYMSILNDSKISLCPSGASVETYRHFESLRHGCVTVSTMLPDVWYFKEVPIQIVKSWDELPVLVDRLINNQTLLEEISIKSIEYWYKKFSPEAVADYISSSIYSLE